MAHNLKVVSSNPAPATNLKTLGVSNDFGVFLVPWYPCFYPLISPRDLGSKPAFRVDFTGPQRDHNETGCIRQIQEEQKRLPFGVARAGQVPILPLPWRIASPIFQ